MKDFFSKAANQINGPSAEAALRVFTFCNLAFLFLRPQAVVTPLAKIRPVMLLTIAMTPFVLTRIRRLKGPQVWAFLGFAVLGAAWVPLASNNFWALTTLQGLIQIYLGFVLPLMLFFSCGSGMKLLIRFCLISGFYLGLYSVTHRGFGPGGFLGDENDLCTVLVMFLAVPLFLFPHTKKTSGKLILAIVIASILVGVVATNSRGGFLGLIAVLGGVFVHSTRKIAMLFTGLIVCITSLFFVPQSYWNEMSTISQIDQGTAQGRKDIWKVALAVWMHPPNIIAGTGMRNVQFQLHKFEPAQNRSRFGKSISGRAIHNTYLQLLADLGLIGFGLFVLMSWSSYRGNTKCGRMLSVRLKQLAELRAGMSAAPDKPSRFCREISENDRRILERQLLPAMHFELDRSKALTGAWNAAWLGVLVSMVFIDTLYYPTLWFMAGGSFAIQNHAHSIMNLQDELNESIKTPPNAHNIS